VSFLQKLSQVTQIFICAFLSGACFATPMINQKVVGNTLDFKDHSGKIYSVKLDCRRSTCLLYLHAFGGKLLHKTKLVIPGERIDPQYFRIFSEIDKFVPDYYYVEVGLENCPGFDVCAAGLLIENGKQVTTEEGLQYLRIAREHCRQPNQKC
jgi:hypothetical protein